MIEEALHVIENYLRLVRGYLPSSIAIDVIEELRSYIIEAAEEEGGGILTVESAKRTVARFGAPSEVAEEYIESMMYDESEEDRETALPPTPAPIPSSTRAPIQEHKPPDNLSSNIEGFLHFLLVAIIWISITSLAAGVAAVLVVPLQIGLVAGFGLWIFFINTVKGITPIKRYYDDWPFLQKLTTYPDNFLPKQDRAWMNLDLILSLSAMVSFIFTPIFIPAIPFFIYRIFMINNRLSEKDPISYARRDFTAELLCILTINLGFGFVFISPWYWLMTAFSPFTYILAGFFDVYLMIRLIALTPDLWVDKERAFEESEELESSEYLTADERAEASDRRGKAADYRDTMLKTIAISLIWIILIPAFLIPISGLYSIAYYFLFTVALVQAPALIGLCWGNMARAKRKNIILWDESNHTWSPLRKSLSLPKGTFLVQPTWILRMDIFFTFLLMVGALAVNLIYAIPIQLVYTLFAFSIAMGLRFILLDDRWRNPVGRKFDRAEFVVNLAILFIGTYLISLFYAYAGVWPYSAWSSRVRSELYPIFTSIWSLLSIYLIFSTVARGNSLWSEPLPKSVESTKRMERIVHRDTSSCLQDIKDTYRQSLREILGWNIVLAIIISVIVLLGFETLNSAYIVPDFVRIGVVVGVLCMAGWIWSTFYFIWRKSRASKEKNPRVIGNRSKFEAFVDLLITIGVSWLLLERYDGFLNLAYDYQHHMSSLTYAHAPIGYLVSIVYCILLILIPFTRIVSDLTGLSASGRRFSSHMMQISGIGYVILAGILTGMTAYGGYGTFLEGNILGMTGVILALTVIFIWQAITSKFYKFESNDAEIVYEEVHIIGDLGHGEIDIPTN